jgi:hypothetical protein
MAPVRACSLGDVVRVVAEWSTFVGHRGVVTQTKPHLMVRLEGDTAAMRFGDREVEVSS